jgi:hypothetical protein
MRQPKFPSGGDWTIGGLKQNVEELSDSLALEFFDDCDDLDYFTAAWLESDRIGPVLLLRYKHSQGSGVEVLVDSRVSRQDAIQTLKREFGVAHSSWAWLAKHQTYAEALAEADRHTREAQQENRRSG